MNVANVQKYFVISRYSKLFYSINTRFLRFHIALPHSFAPTIAFHQSRSSLGYLKFVFFLYDI